MTHFCFAEHLQHNPALSCVQVSSYLYCFATNPNLRGGRSCKWFRLRYLSCGKKLQRPARAFLDLRRADAPQWLRYNRANWIAMLSRRGDEAESLYSRGLDAGACEREALLVGIEASVADTVRQRWERHEGESCHLHVHRPGQRLADRFTLIECLGTGGMGEVYLARDEALGREVALKFLHPELASDPEWRARLEREARIACTLTHPSICTLYDLAWNGDTPFLVMEHLTGETLAERLERGPLSRLDTQTVAEGIAAALEHAHSKGVIHSDLKPANVMLTQSGVKVLDFGLAKGPPIGLNAGPATLPDGVRVAGSAPYMSPEQASGKSVDRRSDVFAFGAVLYEMVTGRRAFPGGSRMAVMNAVISQEPAPVTQSATDCPPAIRRVIARCLRKDPGERFQSFGDLAQALRPMQPRRSILRIAAPIAATAIAGAAVLGVVMTRERPPAPSAARLDSIVVMPFDNEGGGPDLEYVAEGLSESLTNALSRLRSVRVIARGTALSFKGKSVDARDAGKRLKVRGVVTGRVSAEGGRFRVQAALIDANEGHQLWGRRYEGGSADLLRIEKELAESVSARVLAGLGRGDPGRARAPTDSAEAYRLYLQGRHALTQNGVDALKKSIAIFQQVLEIDPLFALAHAGIAEAYWNLSVIHIPPETAMPKAAAAAKRALEIDPDLAEAYLSLGVIEYGYRFAWDRAAHFFARAIEANPSYALAHLFSAWTHVMNRRFREGIAEAQAAFELDPLSPFVETGLGQMYYFAGEHEAAIRRLRSVLDFHPAFVSAKQSLGVAYLYADRLDEAMKTLDESAAIDPSQGLPPAYAAYASSRKGDHRRAAEYARRLRELGEKKYISPYHFAVAAVATGDPDAAMKWLRKGWEARDDTVSLVNVDPVFARLHRDPRFIVLLREMGFESTATGAVGRGGQ